MKDLLNKERETVEKDLNIIAEDEKISEVSMDDLKGGLTTFGGKCCSGGNSACHVNNQHFQDQKI